MNKSELNLKILIKSNKMFGSRLLVNMACRSVFRPTFKTTQSFATMSPVYMYLCFDIDKLHPFWEKSTAFPQTSSFETLEKWSCELKRICNSMSIWTALLNCLFWFKVRTFWYHPSLVGFSFVCIIFSKTDRTHKTITLNRTLW